MWKSNLWAFFFHLIYNWFAIMMKYFCKVCVHGFKVKSPPPNTKVLSVLRTRVTCNVVFKRQKLRFLTILSSFSNFKDRYRPMHESLKKKLTRKVLWWRLKINYDSQKHPIYWKFVFSGWIVQKSVLGDTWENTQISHWNIDVLRKWA